MTIKHLGGIFGRNPTFSEVDVEGVMTVNRSGSDGTCIDIQKDGVSLGTLGASVGDLFIQGKLSGHSGLRFDSSAIIPFRDNSISSNTTDLGLSNVRFKNIYLGGNVVVTSGQGIDFSATSGTGTSELFDDYEEGTWTPTVTGTTSGSATVSSIAHANYTKIGNVVIARCYIVVDFSSHTVSGDVQIGGLPFSAATNNEQMSTITYCNWTTADEADITLSARVVTSNARLLKGSSQTAITNSDLISSSGGTIMFGMIYKA